MEKRFEITDKIIEYGIYLYLLLMFLAKGEGVRNIIIFGNFSLWLLTLKHRKGLNLLSAPVSKLLWIYLGVAPLSVIFSIDPLYSLLDLKREILKMALLFPVISTVMTDEIKLKNAILVLYIAAIIIISSAYYSYASRDLEMLKPDTFLVHAWHNRFARYLCMLIPFSLSLYFIWQKRSLKILLTVSLVMSVFALILSTSRAGVAAFISMAFIWAHYLSKTKGYSFRKIILAVTVMSLSLGALSYISFSDVSQRLSKTHKDIYTMNERTELWEAAYYAIMNRPLTGWGYGDDLFHRDEPFKETILKKALPTDKGPHNMFLVILFHQGIIGLIPYILLLFFAIKDFGTQAFKTTGVKSYILMASASVIFGNYVLHSMVTSINLIDLSVLLGLGMAARGTNEHSHT